MQALRSHFPALAQGAAHFDGPGGSQVPDAVGAAVSATLTAAIANRGTTTVAERFADSVVQDARAAVGDLLNVDPAGVVFGRSMTQLTFDFARTLAKTWLPGDEVIVTRLDHDANIRPWVLAGQSAGVVVRWADFDPRTGELPVAGITDLLSAKTRLVAVTAASNLIGTRPDLGAIAAAVHDAGALFFVDGVHFTAHAAVDVAAIGADVFVCSPYKFLGPHCGVLVAGRDLLASLDPDKLLPSSNSVPEKFELGTLPYELLAGTTAAINFLAGLAAPGVEGRRARLLAAMADIEDHEDQLRSTLEQGLAALPGVTLYSRAGLRTPTLLLTIDGRDAGEAQRYLASVGVNAPAGSFYALEASRWLGLGDAGGLRIGLAPYSNLDDVERLLTGLERFLAGS